MEHEARGGDDRSGAGAVVAQHAARSFSDVYGRWWSSPDEVRPDVTGRVSNEQMGVRPDETSEAGILVLGVGRGGDPPPLHDVAEQAPAGDDGRRDAVGDRIRHRAKGT